MKQKLCFLLLSFFIATQGYASQESCNTCNNPCSSCKCSTDPCSTCNKPCSDCTCNVDKCCKPCDKACDCCDCIPKPSCLSPCEDAYNAPYRMGVCWDYFVSASFLYWQALEDGLETGQSISGSSHQNTTWQNLGCNFNPGFKVGLGMNFDWDNWDFYLEYTWLHQSETANNSNNQIEPAFIDTDLDGNKLSSKWKLDFDMLDFAIGRIAYTGRQLLIRPHFGGKAVWIDQSYNQTLSSNDIELIKGNNSSCLWAVGPSAGFQTRWDFYCGFYMFGNMGWSLLYSEFDSITISTNETNGNTTSQSDRKTFTPEMDFALGLGWGDYCDCKCQWYLNVTLGYEFFSFWDQNQWRNFYPSVGNSVDNNLYLHGLTVSARLDF